MFSCNNEQKQYSTQKNTMAQVNYYSGKIIEFYKNGVKKFEMKYLNGLPDGKYFYWYKNGKLKNEGVYVNGKRQGVWKWYNEKGFVEFVVNYDYLLSSVERKD